MQSIPFLIPGSKIVILAPAKAIEERFVRSSLAYFSDLGYRVEVSKNCLGKHFYFSGTVAERLSDLQTALDDASVSAIVCARGGYGSVALLEHLDWSGFAQAPKWIVGFSDITVLHQALQRRGFPSIHAWMPLNIDTVKVEARDTLACLISGNKYNYDLAPSKENRLGRASGRILGGNLSIVYSMLGTDDQPDYAGSLLYVEDLCEQLYHVDRMFFALAKSGVLQQISGLIVGGMSDMKDVADGFGMDLNALILQHVKRDIPVVFNFPAGHIDDNRSLLLGASYTLDVAETAVKLTHD